jgi:acetolactate synthase I/II/III large subunit
MVESDAAPIRPERIVADIGKVLPADGAAVIDTLQSSVWSGSHMALKGPTQRFLRCAGSLGWGLPASIGAKCALGDRPVVCFTGDGGAYYHLAELETAARYGIPVVVVINNNGAYGGDNPDQASVYRTEGARDLELNWKFGQRDFARIARELGCDGARIESARDLEPALRRGLGAGKPVVIDVVADPTAIHPRAWTPTALAAAAV